jgi:hypothetical protein
MKDLFIFAMSNGHSTSSMDVQQKRSEYMQRVRERMDEELPPEKDCSLRISR